MEKSLSTSNKPVVGRQFFMASLISVHLVNAWSNNCSKLVFPECLCNKNPLENRGSVSFCSKRHFICYQVKDCIFLCTKRSSDHYRNWGFSKLTFPHPTCIQALFLSPMGLGLGKYHNYSCSAPAIPLGINFPSSLTQEPLVFCPHSCDRLTC